MMSMGFKTHMGMGVGQQIFTHKKPTPIAVVHGFGGGIYNYVAIFILSVLKSYAPYVCYD